MKAQIKNPAATAGSILQNAQTDISTDAVQASSTPDLQQAEHFLTLLDESADAFTFQTFDDKADRKDDNLAKVHNGTLAECWGDLVAASAAGAGVFVTVNRTNLAGRKKKVNMVGVRAVFEEQDNRDAPRPEYPIEPHIEVESSPGKYHRYWLCDGLDLDEWSGIQQGIVNAYGSDQTATEGHNRVLRVPGFFHQKDPDNPFMVRIVNESLQQCCSADQIRAAFPAGEKPNSRKRNKGNGKAPPPSTTGPLSPEHYALAVKLSQQAAARTHEDPHSSRHSEVVLLGHIACREGLPRREKLVELCLETFAANMRSTDAGGNETGMNFENETKGFQAGYDGSLDEGEHGSKVKTMDANKMFGDSSYIDYESASYRESINGAVSHDDLTADKGESVDLWLYTIKAEGWNGQQAPEINWIWEHWLPRGSVSGLGGPPGAAKSLLGQMLATHVAMGIDYLGDEIIQAPALYVTCEDPLDELQRRQQRINRSLFIDYEALQDLYLSSWVGIDAALVTVKKSGRLERTHRFRELDKLIGDTGAKYVCLDLLADMWTGNENDRQQVNSLVKGQISYLAQKHDAAIVGIYHPSRSGMMSGTGESGSTAWEGSFRSRIYIDRANKDDPENPARVVKRMKANYSGLDEKAVTWSYGYLEPVSKHDAWRADRDSQGDTREAFLACMRYAQDRNLDVSIANNSPHFYGKQFPEYWKAIDGRQKGINRKRFESVYLGMLNDGLIEVIQGNRHGGKHLKLK